MADMADMSHWRRPHTTRYHTTRYDEWLEDQEKYEALSTKGRDDGFTAAWNRVFPERPVGEDGQFLDSSAADRPLAESSRKRGRCETCDVSTREAKKPRDDHVLRVETSLPVETTLVDTSPEPSPAMLSPVLFG
jgi:hypothetical protein